jgi:hypothetical protein
MRRWQNTRKTVELAPLRVGDPRDLIKLKTPSSVGWSNWVIFHKQWFEGPQHCTAEVPINTISS